MVCGKGPMFAEPTAVHTFCRKPGALATSGALGEQSGDGRSLLARAFCACPVILRPVLSPVRRFDSFLCRQFPAGVYGECKVPSCAAKVQCSQSQPRLRYAGQRSDPVGAGETEADRQHVFGFVRRPTGTTDPRLEDLKSHLRVHEFDAGDMTVLCGLVCGGMAGPSQGKVPLVPVLDALRAREDVRDSPARCGLKRPKTMVCRPLRSAAIGLRTLSYVPLIGSRRARGSGTGMPNCQPQRLAKRSCGPQRGKKAPAL